MAEELKNSGVSADVIDLRTLRPLDTETILRSVAKTNRVLVIQEQHEVASYGAYLSHMIMDRAFDHLDAPVKVVSSLEVPIPYSKALDVVVLPNKERCLQAAHEVLRGAR